MLKVGVQEQGSLGVAMLSRSGDASASAATQVGCQSQAGHQRILRRDGVRFRRPRLMRNGRDRARASARYHETVPNRPDQ